MPRPPLPERRTGKRLTPDERKKISDDLRAKFLAEVADADDMQVSVWVSETTDENDQPEVNVILEPKGPRY